MKNTYYIGIDGGGTKTNFILFDSNKNSIASVLMPTIHPAQTSFKEAVSILAEAREKLLINIKDCDYDLKVGAGLGGYGINKDYIKKLEDEFSSVFEEFRLYSDAYAAMLGALGGDDGIAVAYALAFLDGNYPHPNLEVLITTQEELGMEGALAVTGEHLSGKYLFNIDGEVENELLVGCAGGVTITSVKELKTVEPTLKDAYKIEIEELTGGHSGQEIHKSRANSIKIAAQLLDKISGKVELISLTGGSKHNAVPTTAVIELFADNEAVEELKKKAEELKKNYKISDPDMKIVITSIDSGEKVWTCETLKAVVETLIAVPDGVCYMDPVLDGLVETSLSNGVLEQKDGKLYLTTLLRSSNKARETEVKRRFELIVTSNGFEMSDNGGYPGWQYDPDSRLRVKAIEVYKKQFGKEPSVKTMHCGLECGILKIPLPNTDMITFGPDMQAIHTVNERLNIESVGRIWEFLKTLVISLD